MQAAGVAANRRTAIRGRVTPPPHLPHAPAPAGARQVAEDGQSAATAVVARQGYGRGGQPRPCEPRRTRSCRRPARSRRPRQSGQRLHALAPALDPAARLVEPDNEVRSPLRCAAGRPDAPVFDQHEQGQEGPSSQPPCVVAIPRNNCGFTLASSALALRARLQSTRLGKSGSVNTNRLA